MNHPVGLGMAYLVAAGVCITAACDGRPRDTDRPPPKEECTLMACFSSVHVVIERVARAETVHVEAVALGRAPAAVVAGTCVGDACGEPGVRFDDFAPDSIRLRVRARGATREWVLAPVYLGAYINGRHCRPACRRARVDLTAGVP